MNLDDKINLKINITNFTRFESKTTLSGHDKLDVSDLFDWDEKEKYSKKAVYEIEKTVSLGKLLSLVKEQATKLAINYITRRDED